MKNVIIILAAAIAAFAIVSCNKIETTADLSSNDICFDITVDSPYETGTKAVKTGWADGDKINVWFGNYANYTPDLILTYDGSKWVAGSLREGASLDATGTLKALYEGFNDFTGKSFTGRTGGQFWSWSYARNYSNDCYWMPIVLAAKGCPIAIPEALYRRT